MSLAQRLHHPVGRKHGHEDAMALLSRRRGLEVTVHLAEKLEADHQTKGLCLAPFLHSL